jgi:hypothetical protein
MEDFDYDATQQYIEEIESVSQNNTEDKQGNHCLISMKTTDIEKDVTKTQTEKGTNEPGENCIVILVNYVEGTSDKIGKQEDKSDNTAIQENTSDKPAIQEKPKQKEKGKKWCNHFIFIDLTEDTQLVKVSPSRNLGEWKKSEVFTLARVVQLTALSRLKNEIPSASV